MLKEIIEILSLIIVPIMAVIGIIAWRWEFRGKKKFELAEEVLALSFDCRDRLWSIRDQLALGSEGSTRKRSANETTKESEWLDQAFIVTERYQEQKDAFLRLFTLRYRFAALFGIDKAEPIAELKAIVGKIHWSAHILPWVLKERDETQKFASDEEKERVSEIIHRHRHVIYRKDPNDDEVSDEVDEIVRKIEGTCAAILQPPVDAAIESVADCFRARVRKK